MVLGAFASVPVGVVPVLPPVPEDVPLVGLAEVPEVVTDWVGRVADPPGVPGAVEAAETVVELPLSEVEASMSFSAIENGELVAMILLMFETSTN